MSSESLGFYGKINQLQIDTAGLDNILNGVDLIEIKSNLNNGGNTFKQAFDLIMQANKYVSESVSNVAIIDNALATLKDGYKKQNSALAYFYLATSKMETLKKVLSDKIENEGCLK